MAMKYRLAETCELTTSQGLKRSDAVSRLAPMGPLFAQKTTKKLLDSLVVVVPPAQLHSYDFQLEQAMQLYQERLYKAVYRRLRSYDSAEDILQLTWIKLHDHLIKLGQLPAPLESLYPWLWVVARHLTIDWQEKQQHLRSLSTSSWLLEPRIRAFEHPDIVVIRREIREEILKALCLLPQKQQHACILYFLYGLKLNDIAVQFRCNLNTVKSYIYRDGIPALCTALKGKGIQIEDLNFWAEHKESILEQYRSGTYDTEALSNM